MEDVEVAVVGAGPHGLTAAVHLQRAGVNVQVFGEPMSFWETMPRGMKLRSSRSATSMVETNGPLSLQSYAAEIGAPVTYPVPLERFIEYGRWVQQRAVPDLDHRRVDRVERRPGGFSLELADGELVFARRVVVACGIAPFARIPAEFRGLPRDLVSHTGEHSDLSVFAHRRVAVVGGGQSAFECAALMQEHEADVEVLVRQSAVVWLKSRSPKTVMGPLGDVVYAPTDVGPAWYSRLVAAPDVFRRLPRASQAKIAHRSIRPACSHFVRVRLDNVNLTLGARVVSAQAVADGVHVTLSDGTTRTVDHLLLGTGYKVDIANYSFLSQNINNGLRRVDGYPELRRGLESSVPGLHFMGAPASRSFGPILRFVSGSWYSGRALSLAIGSRVHRATVGARSADRAARVLKLGR